MFYLLIELKRPGESKDKAESLPGAPVEKSNGNANATSA
jgi:hypothetical protein